MTYTVTREKTGRIYSQVVRHPDGRHIQSFGDSQEREANKLAALLNEAYALGRADQFHADHDPQPLKEA